MNHIGIQLIAGDSHGSQDLVLAGYQFPSDHSTQSFQQKRPGVSPADRIDDSIAYMKSHLSESLRVAKLAEIAGVSLPHYFALFKNRTGHSPLCYFIQLRMEQARRLLAATALSIKEIADAMGYDDQFYFSRIFKSVSGLSPTEYRESVASQQTVPLQLQQYDRNGKDAFEFESPRLALGKASAQYTT